ncbi:MAG: hypothetical protein EP343_09540 [Deltaproteobacteria bacterium]|nr:MAG: hypothetical protein EP343_09540 [Deltaproteobacteria bacterium]
MKTPIYFGLLVLFLLTGCASPNPSPEGENPGEASSSYDASEGGAEEPATSEPSSPDEPNPTDSSEGPDSSETPDGSDLQDASEPTEEPNTPEVPDTPPSVQPRLLALSKDGRVAALQLTSPWKVLSTGDLKQPSASARCFGGRCVIVHPSPSDSLSVVDPLDLSKATTIKLESGADPRDVAFVDNKTILVSQYGKSALLQLDLDSGSKESIDLSPLADADGVPEMLRMAHCEKQVFVQLLRLDHKTEAPSSMGPGLAVIDLNAQGSDRLVDADPSTPGKQAIKLSGSPNHDMPLNCKTGTLYIAEPKPLMQGGGSYEQVDVKTLKASKAPIDHGAQVGGFVVVEPGMYWLITHTATSPAGNSSHLNLEGVQGTTTYNTFAYDKVDELVLDPSQDLLFFPDNCETKPTYPQCASGVHVFHARTGTPADNGVISLGFPPMELAISR